MELRRARPGRPVVALSDGRGVGYLLKDRVVDVAEFIAALRRVAAGGTVADPQVVRQLVRRRRHPLTALSAREPAGVRRLVAGYGRTRCGCRRPSEKLVMAAQDSDSVARTGDVTMDLTIEPLTAERWPALEDLFGRAGASNGCWCMYWRIGPAYASRPGADNQRDLRRLAEDGPAPGLIALAGDLAVGWCELAPRADLTWLARARYLAPVDDLPVWSLPCFYVRRGHRGQGVMSALIEAALPAAAAAGAPAVEAYPVDTEVPAHTRNLFPGVAAVFAAHGFEEVARRKADRPVMRRLAAGPRRPSQ